MARKSSSPFGLAADHSLSGLARFPHGANLGEGGIEGIGTANASGQGQRHQIILTRPSDAQAGELAHLVQDRADRTAVAPRPESLRAA